MTHTAKVLLYVTSVLQNKCVIKVSAIVSDSGCSSEEMNGNIRIYHVSYFSRDGSEDGSEFWNSHKTLPQK